MYARVVDPAGALSGAAHVAIRRPQYQLHHVRDRTFRGNGSKIRTGRLPLTMASLRNFAIGVRCQDGHTNIAVALRPGRPRLSPTLDCIRPQLTNQDTRSLLRIPGWRVRTDKGRHRQPP
ncbi:hypothetical protein GCM10010358_80070 [Streptomyces minutiscleroticus]|uniref:Uncharacterized protein n=1 Tax=Streptomyces minutiscleroticus TaxID=68238 RepID=A0A918P2R5_9ACTN|nr:hypothetical protein GCM10010358_80070 [Streptomyces minutiscleroticus]